MSKQTDASHMVAGLRKILRRREYSARTEEAYLRWIEDFWRFHSNPHWRSVGSRHAEQFLDHLAERRRLSASTRNQAATALSFLFREVLESDALDGIPRAKGRRSVPVVLSHKEAMGVLGELRGKYFLAAALLYGAGLRISEAIGLRVKDVDFELDQIVVRNGKGAKDRITPLPRAVRRHLGESREDARRLLAADRRRGAGWAPLPGALHRKDPRAGHSLGWQFVFPSSRITKDPATGQRGRFHLHQSALQRKVKEAVAASGIVKNASCHTFRHSFATQSLIDGVDIRTLQVVMGHKDIRTTMIYLEAVDQIGPAMRSPLDRLLPVEGLD